MQQAGGGVIPAAALRRWGLTPVVHGRTLKVGPHGRPEQRGLSDAMAGQDLDPLDSCIKLQLSSQQLLHGQDQA